MPHGLSEKVRERAYEVLKYMEKESPCTTIAAISRAFNLSWSQARLALKVLTESKLVVEYVIGDKMIWCVDEKAAAHEIYTLKHELWRILCQRKQKFVRPSQIVKWISEDPTARTIFSRYINADKITSGPLKFIAAILKELVGKPIDKTPRKTIYYVPRDLCQKEPQPEDIMIKPYRQPHNNVTVRVPMAMYNDLMSLADTLGISLAELVRMAILRLISQYQHVLVGKRQ